MGNCIDCGSQILFCEIPIRFDTYRGCGHKCKYCFVQKNGKKDNNEIRTDKHIIKRLSEFVCGKRSRTTDWCDWDIPLHWGGISDPFQPAEEKYRCSRNALKVFAETSYPFVVSTKGRLVAETDYLSLLSRCRCVVQISAVCSKYDRLEPGAPTFEERLEIIRKIAPKVPRVIVRMQPYFPEVISDVLQNIPLLAEAGVHGITIEGIKYAKRKPGMIRCGGDYVFPVSLLERHYQTIRNACHNTGMRFYCAENRLRHMGDARCCCGIDGLNGFRGNEYNAYNILSGMPVQPTECMEHAHADVYRAITQDTVSARHLAYVSFAQEMRAMVARRGDYLKEILGLNRER